MSLSTRFGAFIGRLLVPTMIVLVRHLALTMIVLFVASAAIVWLVLELVTGGRIIWWVAVILSVVAASIPSLWFWRRIRQYSRFVEASLVKLEELLPILRPIKFKELLATLVPEPTVSDGDWSDREIDTKERDRFGFQDYARVLARRAREADTPLTIGLFGRWGSGKTSLMKLIQREVQELTSSIDSIQREVKKSIGSVPFTTGTLWINVWQLSNQEELWRAFLQSLFTQAHAKLSRRQRIRFNWTLFHRRVKWLTLTRMLLVNSYRVIIAVTPILLAALWPDKSVTTTGQLLAFILNPVTGGAASLVLGLWLVVQPAIEAARDKISLDLDQVLKEAPYEARVSALQQLEQQFSELVRLWVGEEGRLIVFIDDLDRCTPTKVHEVLEAIKLFATTPGCVYVLGLDYEIVRKAIQENYKFGSGTEAADYLDKIVQIPFNLPPLDDKRLANYVREYYPSIAQTCPTAPDVFSHGLEPNPRKVKRVLNVYRTLLDLAEVRVEAWDMDPVEPELVAKMVVIQNRFRSLYDDLVHTPMLIGHIEDWACGFQHPDDVDPTGEKYDDPSAQAEAVEFQAVLGRLVPEPDRLALAALLESGHARFAKLDTEEIAAYIYLTGAVESGAEHVRPNRKVRDALLSGNISAIKQQVDTILSGYPDDDAKRKKTRRAYVDRLWGVWRDRQRYYALERRSTSEVLRMFGEWSIEIPSGPFFMGSAEADQDALDSEKPQHEVNLPIYRIGRYPVTNVEYQLFVQEARHSPPVPWTRDNYLPGADDHPVAQVSWHDAIDYCNWLTQRLRGVGELGNDQVVRLPTEAEWEKAARGIDGRIYPWGNEFNPKNLNTTANPTPVGDFSPMGDSPYGVADMAGAVWEWTLSRWGTSRWETQFKYPYDAADGRNEVAMGYRVLRGGSAIVHPRWARCACRYREWQRGRGTSLIPDTFDEAGFEFIQGMNIEHTQRLATNGIKTIAQLATASIPDLTMKLNLPKTRIVDWVDQAILLMYAGQESCDRLRRIGVRTASDFLQAARDLSSIDRWAREAGFTRDGVLLLSQDLQPVRFIGFRVIVTEA